MLITFSPKRYELTKPKGKCCTSPAKLQLKSQPCADQVNFGARGSYEFALKEISGIPCIYCNEIMKTTKEQKIFGKEVAELSGEKLRAKIEFIKDMKNEKNEDLFPFVQNLARLLTEKSLEHPRGNLQELLIEMFPPAEEKLIQHQTEILNKLPEIFDKLTGETKEKAFDKLDKINAVLHHENQELLFKKKPILESFKKLQKAETDPENQIHLEEAFQTLVKLPRAVDNTNAFIVKYSRRSSREIGEVLLDPFLSSAEHLIPDSQGGSSKQYNLVGAHKHCNEDRNVEEFTSVIEKRPVIIANTKNQVRIVSEKLKNYEISFILNRWPGQISRTLKKITNGVIDINTRDFNYDNKTLEKLQRIMENKEKLENTNKIVRPKGNS